MSEGQVKEFYSKLLLFGEYSIIQNSLALAIPYPLFKGSLKFAKQENRVDSELKSFCDFLQDLTESNHLISDIDVTALEFDIQQGLIFDSTIPQGFGVGSSAALCAAIYERYSKDKVLFSCEDLKDIFSQLEAHFHGKSSGIDPLISYSNQAILIGNDGKIEQTQLPEFKSISGCGMFLLDTSRPRRTEPLMNLYLEKLKDRNFCKLCENELLPITNDCITSFLEGDIETLEQSFSELSSFQYDNFSPMIPNLLKKIWKQGIDSKNYSLKLCGAGGGGFFLGYTPDMKNLRKMIDGFTVRPLFDF